MALTGFELLSHQIRIGEATAISLSSDNNQFYSIYRCDRQVEIKEYGIGISGAATITDASSPATAYIKTELRNMTKSTKIAAGGTLLGHGGSGNTNLLPHSYTAIATANTIGTLGNAEASSGDMIVLKILQTNKGASAGLPYPFARIQYSAIE